MCALRLEDQEVRYWFLIRAHFGPRGNLVISGETSVATTLLPRMLWSQRAAGLRLGYLVTHIKGRWETADPSKVLIGQGSMVPWWSLDRGKAQGTL